MNLAEDLVPGRKPWGRSGALSGAGTNGSEVAARGSLITEESGCVGTGALLRCAAVGGTSVSPGVPLVGHFC